MYETNENQFEVRRGMVFFIDLSKMGQIKSQHTPTKSRPYVVLSNDKCNENSAMVHVAPIYTRDYDESERRWYNVPFKGADGRNCIIDVAAITLIPKTFLTSTNYSASITGKVRYNADLMHSVNSAIIRQFEVDSSSVPVRDETLDLISKFPVFNQPVPQIQIPNITLNISVNGVPVSDQNVSITTSTDNVSDKITENTQNTVKVKESEPKKKIAKATPVVEDSTRFEKIALKPLQSMTDDQKKRLHDFILENYEKFGGNMSVAKLAKETGVSEPTIRKNITEIDAYALSGKKPGRKSKFTLPPSMYKEFVEYYKANGIKKTLEKYRKFGFKVPDEVYHKMSSMKRYIERHEAKKEKIVK